MFSLGKLNGIQVKILLNAHFLNKKMLNRLASADKLECYIYNKVNGRYKEESSTYYDSRWYLNKVEH